MKTMTGTRVKAREFSILRTSGPICRSVHCVVQINLKIENITRVCKYHLVVLATLIL